MNSKVNKILFSLAETDKDIESRRVRRAELEGNRDSLTSRLSEARARLGEVEARYREAAGRHQIEESRLRDEETKIVERRKQLTALGGVKSAKLVERELDIATRVLETMEKNANDAMQVVEQSERELANLRDQVAELEQELEEKSGGWEQQLADLSSELAKLEKERLTFLDKVEDRLKNLYARVNTRYPGDAVASAQSGACRSCFRALPAQTYNQVMAGNSLIQCPGCSRILVYGDS